MPLRIESNNCTVRCDWKMLSFWTLTGHWVGNIFSCQKPLHTVFQRYDYFDCIPHAWFQSCSFFHLRCVLCILLECFEFVLMITVIVHIPCYFVCFLSSKYPVKFFASTRLVIRSFSRHELLLVVTMDVRPRQVGEGMAAPHFDVHNVLFSIRVTLLKRDTKSCLSH